MISVYENVSRDSKEKEAKVAYSHIISWVFAIQQNDIRLLNYFYLHCVIQLEIRSQA